jgi:flagellar M-ring protein FliF
LVTLQEMPFVISPAIEQLQALQTQSKWPMWLEIASRWGAFGGAIVMILIFLRILSKQKPEAVPIELLSMPPENVTRAIASGNGSQANVTADMVNDLIRQKPTEVSAALTNWVSSAPGNKV